MNRNVQAQSCHTIDSRIINAGVIETRYTHDVSDKKWDEYLDSYEDTHYYQTSRWARTKKHDGWNPIITHITLNGTIVGGYLLLWRHKRALGKIALLLRGPVTNTDDDQVVQYAIESIKNITEIHKIRATIIQPMDFNKKIAHHMASLKTVKNHLDYTVKENTVRVDLRCDEAEVFHNIDRKKRQNINKAEKNGIVVKEGGRSELGIFFKLMLATCQRQKVFPSPSKLSYLYALWDSHAPTGNIKLHLSYYKEDAISGIIVITLAKTAYLWKFGWSGKYYENRPNELLYWNVFKWAKKCGYHFADLDSVSRSIAETKQNQEKPRTLDTTTYSFFKTDMGGDIIKLPQAHVYIPNKFLRICHEMSMPFINRNEKLKKKILAGNV